MIEPARISSVNGRPARVTRVNQAQLSSLHRGNSLISGFSSTFSEFHEQNARNQQLKFDDNRQRRIYTASDRFHDEDSRTISSFSFDHLHRSHLQSLHRTEKSFLRIPSIHVRG